MRRAQKKIGNEAEAQAFAAKVQELLSRYKLSMSEVEYRARDEKEPIGEEVMNMKEHNLKFKRRRVEWFEKLAYVVAKAHYCKTLVTRGTNLVWFVGRKTDRKLAEHVFVTLVHALDGGGKYYEGIAGRAYVEYYNKCKADGDVTLARGFRESFLTGFIIRLNQRFEEEFKSMVNETSTSTAIVRLSNALKEVDQYLDDKYKNNQAAPFSSKSNFNHAGYRSGKAAADSINLRPKALENEGQDRKRLR